MIAQSKFQCQPANKPLTEIMDVPGLKPETLFQTVLAFAIATCLVLCAKDPESLEADLEPDHMEGGRLVRSNGQLKDLAKTLEMAGKIAGHSEETLPVIVMVTREVTQEQFNEWEERYKEIVKAAFPKSPRHIVFLRKLQRAC